MGGREGDREREEGERSCEGGRERESYSVLRHERESASLP